VPQVKESGFSFDGDNFAFMRHGNGKVNSGVTSAAATKPKQRQHLGTYEAITKNPAKYEKMYSKSIASRIPPQILKLEIGNTDLSI